MGKSVGCGCDYCMSRGVRRDFRHDFSDGYEDIPHHKAKRPSRKVCPKGDGEACDFNRRVTAGFMPNTETRYGSSWGHYECVRCGRHGKYWYTSGGDKYRYSTERPPRSPKMGKSKLPR